MAEEIMPDQVEVTVAIRSVQDRNTPINIPEIIGCPEPGEGGGVQDDDPRLSDAREPLLHGHSIAQVTGLQAELDSKQPAGSYAAASALAAEAVRATAAEAALEAELEGKQDAGAYATTASLTAGLATKAASSHTHTIANVTGLQAALDAAAASGGGGGVQTFAGEIFVTTMTEASLRNAVNLAISTRSGDNCTKRILLGAGTITVASEDLIGSPTGGNSDQIFGLEIVGLGPRVSTIRFTNDGKTLNADPRRNNLITAANRLRYFKLQDVTMTSTNSYNNMLWAWSVSKIDANSIYPEYGFGQNQRCQFVNVEWQGPWNRVIGIDGDENANNNSEWLLRDCCTTNSSAFTDAFLHCGGISGSFIQQAQFLNFRVDNCNMTLASGNVFRFNRGGSIFITGGSWSAASSSGNICWFNLERSTDITAMVLNIESVRFEPKSGNHLVIDCRWGSGHVTFQSCSDVASLQYPKGSTQSGFNLHRYVGLNNRIPIVRYVDCTLVGVHKVTGFNGGAGKMIYEGTTLYHWNEPMATAVDKTDGFLQWSGGGKPRAAFRDLDGSIADLSSP